MIHLPIDWCIHVTHMCLFCDIVVVHGIMLRSWLSHKVRRVLSSIKPRLQVILLVIRVKIPRDHRYTLLLLPCQPPFLCLVRYSLAPNTNIIYIAIVNIVIWACWIFDLNVKANPHNMMFCTKVLVNQWIIAYTWCTIYCHRPIIDQHHGCWAWLQAKKWRIVCYVWWSIQCDGFVTRCVCTPQCHDARYVHWLLICCTSVCLLIIVVWYCNGIVTISSTWW